MLCYEDIEQTSVERLWFPYIPFGKLTIIQENPGEGKTYFAMMLTAACTNRKLFSNMEDIEPFIDDSTDGIMKKYFIIN